MSERFRHEDIASVPAGWKVRTVTTSGGHRVRVAFPPGRRVKGAGRLVSILHPLSGSNPCGNPCSIRSTNPQELLVMGANPPRTRTIPEILNECDKLRAALRRRMNPSSLKVGDKVSFHGHDGKDYNARIVEIKRGIAVIQYPVPGYAGEATAYVPRKEWRQRFNPESGHASPRRVFWDDSIQKFTAHKYLSKYGNIIASGKSKAEAIRNLTAAIARAKTGSHNPNPHELLIMGANPRVEVVHGENPPVEDIHEEFTGQEVKWIDVYNEPHMPAGRYAELGPLIALYVKPVKGGPVLRIGAPENHEDFADWWDKKPPIIVTDSSAKQIFFVDGCQNISPLLEQFGAVETDQGLMLGQVRRIDYECRKEHVAHPDEDRWKHDHGDEDGQLPTLIFDARHKRMRYQGGNYRIEGPWIKN